MVKYDVRSKIIEIVRLVKRAPFATERDLAEHIFALACDPKRKSQFRRCVRDEFGQTTTVACTIDNIIRRVRLCAKLGIIEFHDGKPSLSPYSPVIKTGAELDKLIEQRMIIYLERHGASIDAIRFAMDNVRRRDARSIWEALPYVDLGRDTFRQLLHLFTQVSPTFVPHVGKTFDYQRP